MFAASALRNQVLMLSQGTEVVFVTGTTLSFSDGESNDDDI